MKYVCLLFLALNLILAPVSTLGQQSDKQTSRDFVSVGESLDQGPTNKESLPELWGLVVGVSEYKYGDQSNGDTKIKNLRYAARDADAVYQFLISENGGFKKDHVVKLTDQTATKAKVEEARRHGGAERKSFEDLTVFMHQSVLTTRNHKILAASAEYWWTRGASRSRC